jgi:hypothetical protein
LAAAGTWSIEMVSAAAPPATSAMAAAKAHKIILCMTHPLFAVFLRPLPQAQSKLEYECDKVMIFYRTIHRSNLTARTCLIVILVEL